MDNWHQQQIADRLGKSRPLISMYLTHRGVDCTPRRKHRIYTFNEGFFSVLDAARAYWFGFLLADGHVGKKKRFMRVVLQRKDEGHLRAFAAAMHLERGPVDFKRRADGKVKTMPGIELCSVRMCRDLDAFGFSAFKRGDPMAVANSVPMHLMSHLTRGIFDGDGSITYYKGQVRISIVDAHEPVVRWIRDQLARAVGLSAVKLVPSKRRTAWKFTYGGNKQARRIRTWLYTDSTVCLHRKHERFIRWLA